MRSVDTNVVVRAIAEDDEAQSSIAQSILSEGAHVTSGVLIETEWVLRSVYRWSRARIATAMQALIKGKSIDVADVVALRWAIDRYGRGADWADMVHLVDSRQFDEFLTFDAALLGQAGDSSPVSIRQVQ